MNIKENLNEGSNQYGKGLEFVSQGNIREAKSCFEKALDNGYRNYKVLTSLALVEKALGNKRKTLELLVQAEEIKKNNSIAKILLLSEYMDQGRFHDVIRIARQMEESYPENYESFHAEIAALVKLKNYDDALNKLDSIQETFGKQKTFVNDYIIVLHSLERHDEAWEYFQSKEAFFNKDSSEYLKIKAQLASCLRKKQKAEEAFDKLYKNDKNSSAAISLASLLIMDSKEAQADEYLQDIIRHRKAGRDYYFALFMHAQCLEKQNEEECLIKQAYKDAICIYEEAYKNSKFNVYVMQLAAECYEALGDIENAERCRKLTQEIRDALANNSKKDSE